MTVACASFPPKWCTLYDNELIWLAKRFGKVATVRCHLAARLAA